MQSLVSRFLGFVASLALVAALATPARADRDDHNDNHGNDHGNAAPSHSAPEIDPAGLGAIGALLIGGTLLLKSRRGARPTT